MEDKRITRRDFVRRSLLAGAAMPLIPYAHIEHARILFRLDHSESESIIRSFVSGRDSTIPSDSLKLPPASKLIAHRSLPVLFAFLSTDFWQFRSRSAICSVRYCRDTGQFLHSKTTPLSLGATGIHQAAFLNEGQQVLVFTSAGIQNIFQLNPEGDLSELVHVNKTISISGTRARSPHIPSCEITMGLQRCEVFQRYRLERENRGVLAV